VNAEGLDEGTVSKVYRPKEILAEGSLQEQGFHHLCPCPGDSGDFPPLECDASEPGSRHLKYGARHTVWRGPNVFNFRERKGFGRDFEASRYCRLHQLVD
jgi:hypothetical protein